ncbi:helix-turn-helix domain-containing protein [Corynebacterium sp. CCM 9203]|uniref:helix-turn-helix domain-containing protein n=1 Tax=Corynebacterium sp. CCM 9203 TaxID=3057615 RepID=UPI0035262639
MGPLYVRLAQDGAFTQDELEKAACLNRSYIASLELGHRNVSLKNIAAIAGTLGLSPSALLQEI